MSKPNTTVEIKCDNVEAARYLLGHIANDPELVRRLRSSFANAGMGETDPGFEDLDIESLKVNFNIIPQKIGDVMFIDENELSIIDYDDMKVGSFYCDFKEATMTVKKKEERSDQSPVDPAYFRGLTTMSSVKDALISIPEKVAEAEKVEEEAKAAREVQAHAPSEVVDKPVMEVVKDA